MKTYSQKSSEISREWWTIDASSMPLGKLAVVIADKLMGKSKVTFTPHIDNGDYVVVTNAKNLVVTGAKLTDKKYSTTTPASSAASPNLSSRKFSKKTLLSLFVKLSRECSRRTNWPLTASPASASSKAPSTLTPLRIQRRLNNGRN